MGLFGGHVKTRAPCGEGVVGELEEGRDGWAVFNCGHCTEIGCQRRCTATGNECRPMISGDGRLKVVSVVPNGWRR